MRSVTFLIFVFLSCGNSHGNWHSNVNLSISLELWLLNSALSTCFWFSREKKTQILEMHMRWDGKEDCGFTSTNWEWHILWFFYTLSHSAHICCPFDHNCVGEHFFPRADAKCQNIYIEGWREYDGREAAGLKSEMREWEFILAPVSLLSKLLFSFQLLWIY